MSKLKTKKVVYSWMVDNSIAMYKTKKERSADKRRLTRLLQKRFGINRKLVPCEVTYYEEEVEV
jgi:hypothetical protein